jgi:hypothetical protein
MSATIHFAAHFKGNPTRGIVPHCAKMALRYTNGATTTELAAVTCTRCAKKLGITAAPKPAPANPTGTCQCCFEEFKVLKNNTALHGYKRPGHGYILGRCMGEGAAPYEFSCELTKAFRASLELHVVRVEKSLAALNTPGSVTELGHTMTDYEAPSTERGPYGARPTKLVTVRLGDETVYSGRNTIPSFEQLLKTAIWNKTGELKAVRANIAFLSSKIEAWVLAPLR